MPPTERPGEGGEDGNGGDGFGGGALVASGASVSVTKSTITKNHANGGEGDDGGSDGQGIGGGVYNLRMFTYDVTTVIKKNHASTSKRRHRPISRLRGLSGCGGKSRAGQ